MAHERILITEDEAVVAEDLRVTLTALGYEVAGVASSKAEALALTGQTRPDLVLMDIKLKGDSDGIGAAAEIHEQHRIPVIMLTAHADRATLARAREALPFGYVLKPFDEQGLHATIQTALHLHRAQAALLRVEQRMQEAQRLESLGLVAGGVAHDFNNLLTAILGNTQLARSTLPVDSPAAPFLEGIEQASLRAAGLCAHMLAYSGRQETVLAPLDLNDLVSSTLQIIRASLDPRADLVLDLAPALPRASADRAQLQQVVMSLIRNAAESLAARSGIVTISTREATLDREALRGAALGDQWEPGPYVQLEVRDNGCGMSAETISKVFDPFFSTKFTGRGLGLAAVHGIARSHRAPVFVRSEPGAGTTFGIFLTLAEEAPAPALAERRPARFRGEGPVLIVEDEPTVLFIIARILERMGFAPIATASGQAALDAMKSGAAKPRLILLDANMPEMDGLATLRGLRAFLPETLVLLVSALPEEAAIERFAGEKIAGVLHKPFRPDQLERKIAEVLA